jgi:hypothetical protein
LNGDAPAQPDPPAGHKTSKNLDWRHLRAHDVIAMPDVWEYPWFAAWDLAFHTVAHAHIDARFAKEQLMLLCQSNYQHPDGRLPAYEWSFDDANPPVHAWAALKVWAINGGQDREFLEAIFARLQANYPAWINREDPTATASSPGGFLGCWQITELWESRQDRDAFFEKYVTPLVPADAPRPTTTVRQIVSYTAR